jgi:hypothetical protein
MGLVDTSYQPWTGDLLGRPRRIAAMVRVGLKLAFDGMITKLFLILSYSIVVVFLGILYIAASVRAPWPMALGNNLYREYLNSGPYGLLLMILTAMVGSRLISRDLKYNATSMYFSKAITRYDYLAAKFCVIALFLLSASFVPSFLLWIGQLAMGQEALSWGERFADLSAIIIHSMIIVVPASAAILAFSALSRNAYVSGILWVLSYLGSQTVGAILEARVKKDWCRLVSWQNLTAHLGNLVYPLRPLKMKTDFFNSAAPVMNCGWETPALILGAVTVLGVIVVLFRLRKFEVQE